MYDELKETFSETYYKKQILSKTETRENLEGSKREVNCQVQEILNKIISRFLIRNFGGQETVG